MRSCRAPAGPRRSKAPRSTRGSTPPAASLPRARCSPSSSREAPADVTAIALVYTVVRILIIAALVYAGLVAATHWAVRRRRLNAFGAWPRFMRRISDPVLHPVERRILRAGGNPQDASLWLLAIVIVGGLIVLWLLGWVLGFVASLAELSRSGPGAWIFALVRAGFIVLEIALIVRVISSWIGLGP